MDPATPNGETPGTTDPKTNANPTPAPQAPAVDPAIEEANKRAAQAEMRANQLANQLKEQADAKAAAEAKELEEQNKFKDLYEQSEAKRKELEAATEKSARDQAVKAESEKLFGEYPDEVKALAEEVGLKLEDTEEDSVAAFKSKLDKISGSIKTPKVTPNNPGVQTPSSEMSSQDLHEIMRDPQKFQDYLQKNFKGVSSMMTKA